MIDSESRQGTMLDGEKEVRRDLAACYRLFAKYGWTDVALTHLSAQVPVLLVPFIMSSLRQKQNPTLWR